MEVNEEGKDSVSEIKPPVNEEGKDSISEIKPLGRKIPPLNRQARWSYFLIEFHWNFTNIPLTLHYLYDYYIYIYTIILNNLFTN